MTTYRRCRAFSNQAYYPALQCEARDGHEMPHRHRRYERADATWDDRARPERAVVIVDPWAWRALVRTLRPS